MIGDGQLIEINEEKLFEEINTTDDSMNIEQAVNKAINFAKRHGNPFTRLVSVRKKGTTWYVRLDVGAFYRDYRTVKINATGRIVGFTK